jgi:hypothetical protein
MQPLRNQIPEPAIKELTRTDTGKTMQTQASFSFSRAGMFRKAEQELKVPCTMLHKRKIPLLLF